MISVTLPYTQTISSGVTTPADTTADSEELQGAALPVDRGDGVSYERVALPNRRAKRALENILRRGGGVLDREGLQRLRQAGSARGRQR